MSFRDREATDMGRGAQGHSSGDLKSSTPLSPAPKEVRYNFLVVGPKKSGKSTFIRSLGHCEATDASPHAEAAEAAFYARHTERALEKIRKREEARAKAEQLRAEALANRGTFTKVLDFIFDEETLPHIPKPVDPVEPPPKDIAEAIKRVDTSRDKKEYRISIKDDLADVTEVSQFLLRTYIWLAREKASKDQNEKKMIDACILCVSAEDCVRRNTENWQNAVAIRHIIDRVWPTGFPVLLFVTKMDKLKSFEGNPTLDLAGLRDELGCLAVFGLDTLSLPQQEFHNLHRKIRDLPLGRPVVPWRSALKDSLQVMQDVCSTVEEVRKHPERPLPTPRGLFHRGVHRVLSSLFNFFMDHYPEFLIALGMTALMVCIFAIPVFGQALGFAAYVTHGWLLMVKLLSLYVQFTELHLLLGVQIASFIILGLTTFGLTYGGVSLIRRALEDAPQEPCNYYGELGYESAVARTLFGEGQEEVVQIAQTDPSYQPVFQPAATNPSGLSPAPVTNLAFSS